MTVRKSIAFAVCKSSTLCYTEYVPSAIPVGVNFFADSAAFPYDIFLQHNFLKAGDAYGLISLLYHFTYVCYNKGGKMKFRIRYGLQAVFRRIHINRQYKDRLFRMVFRRKRELLDLYNAVNGTEYTNVDDLTVITIDDVIYLGMKNDIAFLFGCDMNLYEHQSSWNPNMPLRGLLYFADMLRGYIEKNGLDIYSSGKIKLPVPRYIIFYNGTREAPDKSEMRLSDSFMEYAGEAALECRAVLLNINKGHNKKIMDKCKRLSDYAYFIQAVRDFAVKEQSLEKAVSLAVEECIEKDILADILRKNRAEVMNVVLTSYNVKQHNQTLKREGREEGIRAMVEVCRELDIPDAIIKEKLKEKFNLNDMDADRMLDN